MVYHMWGSEFDFKRLNQAGEYCERLYKKLTKQDVIWKEKYGTLRWEYDCTWIKSDQDALYFFECVKRTVNKFRDVAPEVVCDAYTMCGDKGNALYYKGYFDAILRLNDSGWNPKPKMWRK